MKIGDKIPEFSCNNEIRNLDIISDSKKYLLDHKKINQKTQKSHKLVSKKIQVE